MANYVGCVRTNYFRVKDMDAFKDIVSRIASEDKVSLFVNEENPELVGFGSLSSIMGIYPEKYDEDEDIDFCTDELAAELQKVVAEDDAIIMTEVGNEKLRYVSGGAYIITSREIQYLDLKSIATHTAREMLQNPTWNTEHNY